MLAKGYYEVFGNTVEVTEENFGYDLDSREQIPVDVIVTFGEFICNLEDFDEEVDRV